MSGMRSRYVSDICLIWISPCLGSIFSQNFMIETTCTCTVLKILIYNFKDSDFKPYTDDAHMISIKCRYIWISLFESVHYIWKEIGFHKILWQKWQIKSGFVDIIFWMGAEFYKPRDVDYFNSFYWFDLPFLKIS